MHQQGGEATGDRAIAGHCGVSAPLVGKIRAELAQSGAVNISTYLQARAGAEDGEAARLLMSLKVQEPSE